MGGPLVRGSRTLDQLVAVVAPGASQPFEQIETWVYRRP
jgi:hypothetical protein